MKRILSSIIYLIFIFACRQEDQDPELLNLVIEVTPSDGGTVTPDPGSYRLGENVVLTATPATGYTFLEWQGDASGTNDTIALTMTASKSVIAIFDSIPPVVPPVLTPEPTPVPTPVPTGIPVLRINTLGNAITNEPKVAAELEVYIDSTLQSSTPIGIEFRGKYSYILFDKKSYGFELRDEANQEVSASFLDLPADEDWILYAAANDKSLCRNVLIYELSNQINRYASHTKWVELELNGEYRGVYVLMEKIKRGSNRIDIAKLSADNITGGYIIKIDKTDGELWGDHMIYTEPISFRSNFDINGNLISYSPYGIKQSEETYFLYEYPNAENITTKQKQYIQGFVSDFESALASETFQDGTRLYLNYIDINSFVDYFILNELSANPDAYRISTFLYKDRGGALNIGPVWDFDLAFGNHSRSPQQGWSYQYNITNPTDTWLVHFWWPKLLNDPIFKAAVKARWNELKQSTLNEEHINTLIDGYASELISNGLVERNFGKWDGLITNGGTITEAYEQEIATLKFWLNGRMTWLDQSIQNF